MPTYLWSGITKTGHRQAERVTASTAREAEKILEERGWAELKLHTGEIQNFVKQQIDAGTAPERRVVVSAGEALAYHQGKAGGLWRTWWHEARKQWMIFLILAAFVVWAACAHNLLAAIIPATLFVGLALLFPLSYLREARGGSFLFRKLVIARTWRRWDEVVERLDKLEAAQRIRGRSIGEAVMAHYRALAMSGQGKLNEAVQHFNEAAQAAGMPVWLHSSLLAGIYHEAGEYEKALEYHRRAVAEATEKVTASISLASCLVIRFNRPEEACEALRGVESEPLTEQARIHLALVRGIIEIRRNEFAAANKHLLEALAAFENRAARRRHLFQSSIMETQGYLAVANAGLGNKAIAQKYFSKSEKFLVIVRLDEVIAMYQSHMSRHVAPGKG